MTGLIIIIIINTNINNNNKQVGLLGLITMVSTDYGSQTQKPHLFIMKPAVKTSVNIIMKILIMSSGVNQRNNFELGSLTQPEMMTSQQLVGFVLKQNLFIYIVALSITCGATISNVTHDTQVNVATAATSTLDTQSRSMSTSTATGSSTEFFNGSQLMWKAILGSYKNWQGGYIYDGIGHDCSVIVHSVEYVTFDSDLISLDMKISSENKTTVIFRETNRWHASDSVIIHKDLQFVGHFFSSRSVYYYVGDIISQDSKLLGTVHLYSSETVAIPLRSNTSLQYGLAIGIPVVLAVLLILASVLILRWGIKKGYLRHVPRAYKHFTNPNRSQDRPSIELNPSDDRVIGEQPEVHI